jgi:RNA polymerase sigma factor (sigma-70 family)
LRTLYRCGVVSQLSDEQLLAQFVARRDGSEEELFAELVRRHAPMVLGVCRRVLGDAHEAEDAFQATFLVLARKAAAVAQREKVAAWLYGVAVRTSKEARNRAARRRAREERMGTPIRLVPPSDGVPDELRAILDEEIARLPLRYRGAVVLCELEGLSRGEAARRLGVPEGTLSSRLARAKAQLRDRLVRRGFGLPLVTLFSVLLREARGTTLPFSLAESTVDATTLVVAGSTATAAITPTVASLAEGVLNAMLVAKWKGIMLGLGTLTAVISGAVVLAQTGRVEVVAQTRAPEAALAPALAQVNPSQRAAADRTDALERKLDRILSALDRLTGPSERPTAGVGPPGSATKPSGNRLREPPPRAELPNDLEAPNRELDLVLATGQPLPPPTLPSPSAPVALKPAGSRAPGGARGSLADRLGVLELQMRSVGESLNRIYNRLSVLEKLVGGVATTRPAEDALDTVPPPLAPSPQP